SSDLATSGTVRPRRLEWLQFAETGASPKQPRGEARQEMQAPRPEPGLPTRPPTNPAGTTRAVPTGGTRRGENTTEGVSAGHSTHRRCYELRCRSSRPRVVRSVGRGRLRGRGTAGNGRCPPPQRRYR